MYSVRFAGHIVFKHSDLCAAVEFACSLHRFSNVPHEIVVALEYDSGLYDKQLTLNLHSIENENEI